MRPPSKSKPEIRFERDGNCVSIFEGDKHISAVCWGRRAGRGFLFYCGACNWDALERGEIPAFSECVHVQMVKEYLASTRGHVWHALRSLFKITDSGIERTS